MPLRPPSDLRPPTSDFRPPTSVFRPPASAFRLLASAFCLLASGLLHALPPYQPPAPKLAAQPEPGLRLSAQNTADFNAGRISFLDTPQISHTFTLRNTGETPITVTQLQTTCHCTIVDLLEVAGRKTSLAEQPIFLLEPGQDAKISMTVQLARQVPGRVAQSIFVYADGANAPVATLRLLCELEHGLTANPGALDFGPVRPGETHSRQLTLTYDPRLTGDAPLPPLASQADPHIEATTGSVITITPEKDSATAAAGSTFRTRTYTITIKPTQPGDLAARLYFHDLVRSDYRGTLPFDTAAEIHRALVIPVLAQVVEK